MIASKINPSVHIDTFVDTCKNYGTQNQLCGEFSVVTQITYSKKFHSVT
jgi:hypothetical protein